MPIVSKNQRLNVKDTWQLIKNSLTFFNKNKDLVIIPIITFVATAACMIFMIRELLQNSDVSSNRWILYSFLFAWYFCLSFIIILANAILTITVIKRLNNETASLLDGLATIDQCLFYIIAWSLFTSTVGLVIRLLENSSSIVETVLGTFIGFSWAIATYFTIPILVVEKIGPIQAFHRSVTVFGKVFKKTFSVNAIIAMAFVTIIAIVVVIGYSMPRGSISMFSYLFFIFLSWIVFSITIGTALETIIKSALYLHATQPNAPTVFDEKILNRAMVKSK